MKKMGFYKLCEENQIQDLQSTGMNLEFFFQLYICCDTFAPLPEQYNNISFYFWLINEDHKSYFNVSTA